MAGDISRMNLQYLVFSDFRQGGFLMPVIFAVSIIAWMIGIRKLSLINKIDTSRKRFLKKTDALLTGKRPVDQTTGFENYDRLLIQMDHALNRNAEGCKGIMREFLIGTVPLLERSFSTMSTWISTAPLLGLLGTVIGMIQTFRVIMDFGVGNPSLTAEGISVALLTTQAGLTAAFPAMIFHNHLINRKDTLVAKMLNDCEFFVKSITAATGTKEGDPHV